MNHQFPSNGDGTDPGLWLESIVHTGHAGSTLSMPAVRFDGELRQNRVDGARTSYGPNWTAVDSPTGATPTMEVFDIEGRTIELRQFHGDSPTGGYDATRYTYTRTDQRASVTDPAGNVWRYTYDDEDQVLTSTDARGVTQTTTYDLMGRQTAQFVGQTKVAERTYDTLPNGKGLPVSRRRTVPGYHGHPRRVAKSMDHA